MRSDAIPRRNQPRLGSVLKLLVGTKVVYFRLAMWGISGDLCTVCAATRRDAPSQTASGLVPFCKARERCRFRHSRPVYPHRLAFLACLARGGKRNEPRARCGATC